VRLGHNALAWCSPACAQGWNPRILDQESLPLAGHTLRASTPAVPEGSSFDEPPSGAPAWHQHLRRRQPQGPTSLRLTTPCCCLPPLQLRATAETTSSPAPPAPTNTSLIARWGPEGCLDGPPARASPPCPAAAGSAATQLAAARPPADHQGRASEAQGGRACAGRRGGVEERSAHRRWVLGTARGWVLGAFSC
jgi:hypothetical protein